MVREKIILSDVDLKILSFLKEERTITEVMDYFCFYYTQYKTHAERIKKYFNRRKYGNFVFTKLNEDGINLLNVLKWK